MDTYTFDPIEKEKDDVEHAEKVTHAKIDISLWKDNNYLCKNYILNGLGDDLYDLYRLYDTTKHVWDALHKKYDIKEARSKKYVVNRYLNYKMTDDKFVEAQSHEIWKITPEIYTKVKQLTEQFQIVAVIDKLPPSCKNFKNTIMHKTKEF